MLGGHVTCSAEVWGSILALHTLFCVTYEKSFKSVNNAQLMFSKSKTNKGPMMDANAYATNGGCQCQCQTMMLTPTSTPNANARHQHQC
jgi:hypothetical protein